MFVLEEDVLIPEVVTVVIVIKDSVFQELEQIVLVRKHNYGIHYLHRNDANIESFTKEF